MVAIIEYGMGNVSSVLKALNKINIPAIVTNNETEIRNATHIILPGVGSFGKAMENLHAGNLVSVLKSEALENKKPLFGICLGMQLLAGTGIENGETEGLGLIGGNVRLIPSNGNPVPHMGWNEITIKKDTYFSKTIERNFYFVHSYWLDPADPADVAATVNYGFEMTAAVQKDNIFGTQFHPEKSQQEGIDILKTFFEINA